MRRAVATSSTLAIAFSASAVEHDEPIAALQAQHVAEVMCLALVEREARAIELALDIEAWQTVRRSCHRETGSVRTAPGGLL